MEDRNKKETIQEKLNFYHNKLLELDETEPENYECITYTLRKHNVFNTSSLISISSIFIAW